MTASLVDVYRHHGIPHRVDEGRGGWVSTHCPFCLGSADYHLGFSVAGRYFRCWRCGFHPTIEALSRILHVDRASAAEVARSIRSGIATPAKRVAADAATQARVEISRYRRPSDVGPMGGSHRRYLERRGFDPDEVEREWGVLGTGPASRLDGIDYRYRLLIPIAWDGREVSFQARDVTGRSDLRYVSCPAGRERRHHKHILYGRQDLWGRTAIVVEGATDVWRLGPRACATFGVQYLPEQVREVTRHFRHAAVVFDAEPQAQEQARRLAATLKLCMGEEVRVVDLGASIDPGSMTPDDAAALVRELS